MIPYFPPLSWELGGVRIDGWLALIVVGIAVGTEFARSRAIREKLSVKVTVDTTLVMVLNGFLFAHFVHVLAYNFDRFLEKPILLAPWYGGYSSTGGFLGAAIAIPLFLRLRKAPFWAYLDNLCLGFLIGFALGRVGCFTAHDHLGLKTDFFLAVDFPASLGGPRHDLGLYEALLLLTMFFSSVAIDWFDREKKRISHGMYSAMTLLIYPPMRLLFDSLRATDLELYGRRSDVRYFNDLLTPAQSGALLLFSLGVWMLWTRWGAGRQDLTGKAEPRRTGTATRGGLASPCFGPPLFLDDPSR